MLKIQTTASCERVRPLSDGCTSSCWHCTSGFSLSMMTHAHTTEYATCFHQHLCKKCLQCPTERTYKYSKIMHEVLSQVEPRRKQLYQGANREDMWQVANIEKPCQDSSNKANPDLCYYRCVMVGMYFCKKWRQQSISPKPQVQSRLPSTSTLMVTIYSLLASLQGKLQ